jgi:hypothetical protein
MAKKQLTDADQRDMVKHLHYEVSMLRGGLAEFQARDVDGVMDRDRADPRRIARTAFFETVLLHARVLHDFLAGPPVDDDVWAGHYVEDWEPLKPLDRELRKAINKQLMHFSGKRLQQRRFPMAAIADTIRDGVRAFVQHDDNKNRADLDGVRELLDRQDWPTVS